MVRGEKIKDSFLHDHQSALDSQREDDAIRDLEDAGIYPAPYNDDPYNVLYGEVMEEFPNMQHHDAVLLVYSRWHELDQELDDKHYPMETDYD